MNDLLQEIAELKARENATILAHYYQEGEIQELADFTGDSLKLARAATKVPTGTIVFCGVHFMAETAKMLNPEKRVLLPDLKAGCSLAESCPADKLTRYQEMLRINGRKFQTVTYINSSAAVKALSDWVVTSANAATEANMMWQLQSKFPQHRYHPVPGITCACNKCPHMARNTLEKLRDCLMTGEPEITWQPEFGRAREVLQRSLLN